MLGPVKMKEWTPQEIRELRQSMALYQNAFADVLGVTRNYIHLMEKGVKEPSITLKKLLDCVEKKGAEAKSKGTEKKKKKGKVKKNARNL